MINLPGATHKDIWININAIHTITADPYHPDRGALLYTTGYGSEVEHETIYAFDGSPAALAKWINDQLRAS